MDEGTDPLSYIYILWVTQWWCQIDLQDSGLSCQSLQIKKVRGIQGCAVAVGDSFESRGTVLILLTASLMVGRDSQYISHCWERLLYKHNLKLILKCVTSYTTNVRRWHMRMALFLWGFLKANKSLIVMLIGADLFCIKQNVLELEMISVGWTIVKHSSTKIYIK